MSGRRGIGRNPRHYVWITARQLILPETAYRKIVEFLAVPG